jgi:hypothetical protein
MGESDGTRPVTALLKNLKTAEDLLEECESTWPRVGELEVGRRQSHF